MESFLSRLFDKMNHEGLLIDIELHEESRPMHVDERISLELKLKEIIDRKNWILTQSNRNREV